jgi:hypothetical protein
LAERGGNTDVANREFLDDDAGSERVGSHAAVFLGEAESTQAELRGFFHHRLRKALFEILLAIECIGNWRDFVFGELTHHVADLALFFGQMQVKHHFSSDVVCSGLASRPDRATSGRRQAL